MARISCGDLRFTSKNRNKSTTAQINKWIKEIIALYGTTVDYFVYDYQLLRQDGLLGEDRPAPFKPPVSMTAIINVNNDNLMLSKFGLQTQSDIVMYVDYKTFGNAMGNNLARPKAGDLVRLTELGMDRPLGPYGYPYYGMTDDDDGDGNPCAEKDECGQTADIEALICCKDQNRNTGDDTYTDAMSALSAWNLSGKAPFGPNIYEITTVRDEDIAGNLNPMMGHYVWKIEAIRFDNSYQPDAPIENGSNMVNDAPYYGKLPGGTETPENGKLYPQTTDKEEDTYWDHSKYNLDKVYGGYGYKEMSEVQNEGRITYDPKTDPYSDKYWVVYDSLPFMDLAAAQIGLLKFFDLSVVNEDLKLNKTETPHGKPKAKYYLRDTSNCVDPNRLYVYALFVYDAGIALQYVGDVMSVDDVIYSSIFLKAKTENDDGESDPEQEDAVARLWVKNGSLALTVPVTEEDKKGEGDEEDEAEENESAYTDTETKFENGISTEDLSQKITEPAFELGDLDEPFSNLIHNQYQ